MASMDKTFEAMHEQNQVGSKARGPRVGGIIPLSQDVCTRSYLKVIDLHRDVPEYVLTIISCDIQIC